MGASKLIRKLLRVDVGRRATLEYALHHAWVVVGFGQPPHHSCSLNTVASDARDIRPDTPSSGENNQSLSGDANSRHNYRMVVPKYNELWHESQRKTRPCRIQEILKCKLRNLFNKKLSNSPSGHTDQNVMGISHTVFKSQNAPSLPRSPMWTANRKVQEYRPDPRLDHIPQGWRKTSNPLRSRLYRRCGEFNNAPDIVGKEPRTMLFYSQECLSFSEADPANSPTCSKSYNNLYFHERKQSPPKFIL